ncbi:MAG: hypothetical protein Kow0047_18590 [Anaerolineae bacterium]
MKAPRQLVISLLLAAIVLMTVRCGTATPMPSTSDAASPADPRSTPTVTRLPVPATLFFASDRAGNGDIYRWDADGVHQLTQHPAVDWDPAVSPDGSRIVFTSWREGQADLWLMNADGSGLRRLTDDPADDYAARWAPDGRRIAFVTERAGNQDVYILDVDTGDLTPLAASPRAERDPAWSPDGVHLALTAIDARSGWQRLMIATLDGLGLAPLTDWPTHASAPLWMPDGQEILFLGRERDGAPLGFFTIPANGGTPRPIWMSDVDGRTLPGRPTWGPGGALLFPLWRDGQYRLAALPPGDASPVVLLSGPDIYGTPDAAPGGDALPEPIEWESPSSTPPVRENLALGMNLAGIGNAYLVRDLGFTWGKGYLSWESAEPEPGQYYWVDADNIVNAYETQGLKVLMRVHLTPAWARPANTPLSYPPEDPEDLAAFMGALATRYRGRIHAYEIWNEPNLAYEWGNIWPDPYVYGDMLKAIYPVVKAVDPQALVIAGGVATTGPGSPSAVGDLDWLRAFYAGGARGYFDALSTHPYGFGKPPDAHDPWGLSLDRVLDQRALMIEYGDEETPLWITEMGWPVRTPAWDLGEHQPFVVSQEEQAQYLLDALRRINDEWTWIEGVFPFNLDFSTVTWYPAREQMRWYALLNPDGSPRLSYSRLRRWARGME